MKVILLLIFAFILYKKVFKIKISNSNKNNKDAIDVDYEEVE